MRPEHRREGYGEKLMEHIVAEARARGMKRLFVLTTRTEKWFTERGFVTTDVSSLPAEKKDLYNYERRSKILMREL